MTGFGTPTVPTRGNGHALPPGPEYPMPREDQVVSDTQHYLEQAAAVLRRPYVPAPEPDDDAPGALRPGYKEVRLMAARADVASALRALGEIAATYPARQFHDPFSKSARESAGGPSSHPNAPRGEWLLPGSGAAVATAATESDATVGVASQAGSVDPRPRLSQRAPDGNDVRPGVGPITPEIERFVVEAIRKHIRRHGRSSLL